VTTDIGRVAVVAYHSSPLLQPGVGDAGGMTIYVRALAEALAKRGVSTDVFTRAIARGPRITKIAEGVRVVSIEAGPTTPISKEEQQDHIEAFTAGVRAFAMAQRVRYDVLHSHYWQSGLAARDLAASWDVPWVHSHHTLARVKNHFLAPGDPPEPRARIDGEQDVIDAADVLIASTRDEHWHLARLYGADHDRIKILHPGVDHRLFAPGDRAQARARVGLDPDTAVIAYVGRIQRLKGLELAVRAVEQLAPALDRPIELVLVGGASGGGGEDEILRLRELATSLQIPELLRFVGPRPHSEIPDYHRAADVVVVCSHSESFGLAALEAHACGTPVVATAVGGLSYIVRDGISGFLTDTRDVSQFAGHLKTLLSDTSMLEEFRHAAHRAASSFSWERTADELADLYECLVNERLPEHCVC
jgi:D-inositol-3-phosphate glycosyltransferase